MRPCLHTMFRLIASEADARCRRGKGRVDQATMNDLGIDQGIWVALRECQKNAVRCGIGYLNKPLVQQDHKACLLSLPTGAGKSGVISTLAHYAPQNKVLVLCHRRY